jgi:hypothetical protein
MTVQNWTIIASSALFIVWMQRHGRWTAFIRAMQGQYTIVGAQGAGTNVAGAAGTVGKLPTATPLEEAATAVQPGAGILQYIGGDLWDGAKNFVTRLKHLF